MVYHFHESIFTQAYITSFMIFSFFDVALTILSALKWLFKDHIYINIADILSYLCVGLRVFLSPLSWPILFTLHGYTLVDWTSISLRMCLFLISVSCILRKNPKHAEINLVNMIDKMIRLSWFIYLQNRTANELLNKVNFCPWLYVW